MFTTRSLPARAMRRRKQQLVLEHLEDRVTPATADMAVTMTGPAFQPAGTTASYSVTLTNNGPDAATGVVLTVSDPFVVGVVQPGTGALTAAPGNPDTFNQATQANSFTETATGSIASGNKDIFILTIGFQSTSPNGSTFTASGSVTSTSTDPNSGNDSASVTTTVVQPTDLKVVKTGPATITAGADVTYTLSLTNSGPVEAFNVVLSDALPSGETFVSETQLSGTDSFSDTSSGNTASFTAATVANGNADTFQVVGLVSSSLASGTMVVNTASATAANPQSVSGDNTSSFSSTVAAPADMAVVKTGPSTLPGGDQATYSVTLTNNGPNPATGVVLTDTDQFVPGVVVPGSGSITAAPGNPDTFTEATQANSFTETANGPIAAGNKDVFIVKISFEASSPSGSTFTNSASVSSTSADTNPGNNQSSVTTTIVPSADLAVTKSGPATITAGTSATYTISLTDNGPSDAQSVNLSDVLPNNVVLESESQVSGSDTFTNASSQNSVVFTASTVSAGNTDVFQVIVLAPSSLANGTIETDTTTVSSSTSDANPTNNNATFNSTVTTSADLAVTASGPSTVTAGTNITYTVSLTNNGPSDAAGVTLSDSLPAGLTVVSEAQLSGTDHFNDTTSGNTFSFFASGMSSGNTDVFRFVAHAASGVADGSTISNTVSVTAATTDPSPANNSSTVSTDATTAADLAVTASAPTTVQAGTSVTYTFTVTNNGPSDAQTVTVTDKLPTGLTRVSEMQVSGPDSFTDTSSGNTASFAAATVVSGDSDVFEVVALAASTLTPGTDVPNTVTVASSTTDPNPSNNSATVTSTVSARSQLTVTNSGPATVTAGTSITYSISLTNNGPSSAQNVALTDALPGGLTLISETQVFGIDDFTNTSSGNTVSFTATSMGSSDTDIFRVVAGVASNVANGRVITDTASVTSSTTGTSKINSSVNTTVTTAADLAVTNSGPTVVVAGANMTYTITLTNNGPSDAQNVMVTDSLPVGLTLISATHTSGPAFFSVGRNGSTTTFTASAVTAGDTEVFQIIVNVASSLPNGATVTDTARVSAGTSDPKSSNNSSTLTTNVVAPQHSLFATAGDGTVVFVIGADGKLYQHTNATGWTVIGAAGTVEAISAVTQTNGTVVLFAVGTDRSLSRYIVGSGWQGAIGGKGTIQTISAGLDSTGQADVFVIDNSGKLDEWSTSAGWRTLSPGPGGSAVQLSAVDHDGIYVVTSNGSVYGNTPTFGWFALTSPGFARSISATDDGSGNVTVYAVTINGALYRHVNATGWTGIGNPGSINVVSAGRDTSNLDDVFAITSGNQLAEYDSATGWKTLNPPSPAVKLSATTADELFAVLADGSVEGYDGTFGFFPLTSPGFAPA